MHGNEISLHDLFALIFCWNLSLLKVAVYLWHLFLKFVDEFLAVYCWSWPISVYFIQAMACLLVIRSIVIIDLAIWRSLLFLWLSLSSQRSLISLFILLSRFFDSHRIGFISDGIYFESACLRCEHQRGEALFDVNWKFGNTNTEDDFGLAL